MKCSKCGAVIEDGAKFCPVCGEPVAENHGESSVRYCSKCGKPYEGNPSYCPSCGASLFAQNVGQTAQQFGQDLGDSARQFGKQAQQFGQDIQNGNIGQYFPPSGGSSVPFRNIALYIILTIVTCGLFSIYWQICLVNDLNSASDQPNDTNGITVFLLGLITCGIYDYYWMYKAGDKVSRIKHKLGETDSGNYGILYLILQLLALGLINLCLIQNEINKAANR